MGLGSRALRGRRHAARDGANGALPQWGDGQTHPVTLPREVTPGIANERLDPAVRDLLTRFFLKALARDPRRRFDTAEEMRRAWARIFEVSPNATTRTIFAGSTLAVVEGADPDTRSHRSDSRRECSTRSNG